ncbi:hypothetical protein [Streptomyces sp. MAI_2237]
MARQEQQSSSTTLPEPLRTAASALRHVPGAGTVSRVAGGALDKIGAVSPRGRRLAVYTGAGVLGVAGIVEWPVAVTGAAVAWLTQPRPEEQEPSGDSGESKGAVPAGEIGVIPLDEEPEEPGDEVGEMRAGEVRETPSGQDSQTPSGQKPSSTSSAQVFDAPSGDVGTTPGVGKGGAPGGLPSDSQPVITGDTQLPTGPKAPAPGEAGAMTGGPDPVLGSQAPILGAMEPVTGDGWQASGAQMPEMPEPVAAGDAEEEPVPRATEPVPGEMRHASGTEAPGPVLARDVEDLPGPEAPEPGAAEEAAEAERDGSDGSGVGGRAPGEGV